MSIDPNASSPSTPQKNYSDPEIRCLNMLLNKYLDTSSDAPKDRDAILKVSFENTLPLKERISIVNHALLNSQKSYWPKTIETIAKTFDSFLKGPNKNTSLLESINNSIDPKISILEEQPYQALIEEASSYSSPGTKPTTSLAKKTMSANPVVGITNQGNTCFMNVAFQIIMNDPPLLKALVETYTSLLETEPTNNDYKAFLSAVRAYKEGRNSDINLLPLRALALDKESKKAGKTGDAFEFIQALLNPVPREKYPNLFFPIQHERTFEASSEQNFQPQEIGKERDPLPDSGILKKSDLTPTITLELPAKESDGQNLLNSHFASIQHEDDHVNHTIYKKNGIDTKFYLKTEQITLEEAPPQFMINLKRFTFAPERNQSIKIERKINIPQEITLPLKGGSTQKYTLKSIGVHTGAHYYSLIKKPDQKWIMADDSNVHQATEEEITKALEFGYIYAYEKFSS